MDDTLSIRIEGVHQVHRTLSLSVEKRPLRQETQRPLEGALESRCREPAARGQESCPNPRAFTTRTSLLPFLNFLKGRCWGAARNYIGVRAGGVPPSASAGSGAALRVEPPLGRGVRLHRISGWSNSEHKRIGLCGTVYGRTESMAPFREMNSLECLACGATLETWNTAWVPTYRLIEAC